MLVHVWYAIKDLIIELLYMCITTICLFIYLFILETNTHTMERKRF